MDALEIPPEARIAAITSGFRGSPGHPDDSPKLRELESNYYRRMEAAVEDLRAFFGVNAGHLVTLTLEVNVMDLLMAQRALAAILTDWRVVGEHRYDPEVEVMVKRLAIKVSPERHDFVIRCGRQYWEGPEGRRLATDIWASDDRRIEESEITFSIPAADHDWLVELIPKLRAWIDANHFLRGQAITAEGKFLKFETETAWEDVMIPVDVRESIQRNCIDLLAYRELFRANGMPLKRGLVLHGPPGTGKTMIGRALAQLCGVTFILATPGMLDEAKDVKRIFEWGRRFAPAILFFEDFDLVAGSRHGGGSKKEVVGEFLTGLDGLATAEGVITIATTNDLKAIEPALKDRPNRFDCVLEIPSLGTAERTQYLERWRERSVPCNRPHSFEIEQLVARTSGFTGAQMQELCRLAVFEAVEERIHARRTEAERLGLDDSHFASALKKLGVKRRRKVGFDSELD